MQLIADSGSTKTSWYLAGQYIETLGINPVRDNTCEISNIINSLPDVPVREIFFYGAGCIPPFKQSIHEILSHKYPEAKINVESDMLGAARATCGQSTGLVGILGTGSNSCLYDGKKIVENISPLGFILGDEGSGAVLGRTLVGDALKGQLGEELRHCFLEEMHLTPTLIIERVYRQPQPNRFLASLVPFLHTHQSHPTIQELLLNEFRRFFRRNIAQYKQPDLPVHLVGGIASAFQAEIRSAAEIEGYHVGQILQTPIETLTHYHTNSSL